MADLQIIWFDFGGVLSPPIPALFEQYEVKTGLAPAALQQAMFDVATALGLPMLAPIENALLSELEWGQRLEEALRLNDPQVDLSRSRLRNFGQQWFDGVLPNPAMIDAVKRLKAAGFKVGILTNNVVEWEPHWRAMVDLDEVVDIIVDSSREGCRKPDARFFEIASERVGIAPEHSLLIDDVLENIHSAASLGWQTLHFLDNDDTLARLHALTGVSFPTRQKEDA